MSPFPVVAVAVVLLAILGLPTAHVLIAGATLYLWLVGLDMGMAADRVLDAMAASTLLLAVPMVLVAIRFTAFAVVERGAGRAGPSGAGAAIAATTLALLPPSLPLLLYAAVTDAPLSYLFVAGVLPGLALAAGQLAVFGFGRRDVLAGAIRPFRALPVVFLPAVVVSALLAGVAPAEAVALGALYAVVHALGTRGMAPRAFYRALLDAARDTAVVGLTVAAAIGFNAVVTAEAAPQGLAELFAGMGTSSATFLILFNVVLLLAACAIEGTAVMLVIVPLFVPAAQLLGVDLVHFGVVAAVNVLLGQVLPPSGVRLVAAAHDAHAPLGEVIRHALPSVALMVLALVAVTALPDAVLWLPRLLGYPG